VIELPKLHKVFSNRKGSGIGVILTEALFIGFLTSILLVSVIGVGGFAPTTKSVLTNSTSKMSTVDSSQ
jgi:hypothetical protein